MKVEVTTDIFNEDTFNLVAAYKFEKCGGSWSNTVPEEELEKNSSLIRRKGRGVRATVKWVSRI